MNSFFKTILFSCLCLILFACSRYTQENFEKIKNNMSMKEVIAILGEPTNSESVNIMGIAGTSAVWKDKNAEIDIQFLNNVVVVKAFNSLKNDETRKENENKKKQINN
jgi:hypothetical protein